MNNVEEYLGQFEDFELAFFWKYKLDTYMEDTEKEIKCYLNKRKLDEARMNSLINEYSQYTFPDDELRCPRCKSKKITIAKEKAFGSLDTHKLVNELIDYKDIGSGKIDCGCQVCGFFFSPSKHYSFPRRVLNVVLGFFVPSIFGLDR